MFSQLETVWLFYHIELLKKDMRPNDKFLREMLLNQEGNSENFMEVNETLKIDNNKMKISL